MSNNQTTSERTKYVHIRTTFVKEYQEEGKRLIESDKSEVNDAEINTKNTENVIFQEHQRKIVWDKDEITDEKGMKSIYQSTGRMSKIYFLRLKL